jgi:hypothetical protein
MMKAHLAKCIAIMTALTAVSRGQTINWGSEVSSVVVNSKGAALDKSYVFELGAFRSGFTPDKSNIGDWYLNWNAFDQAAYNKDFGYFTSSAMMEDDGSSSSAYRTPGAPSFEGLEGYLWIRNNEKQGVGTEWLLARAGDWIFPKATPGCCDNGLPIDWSVSDLTSKDTPIYGSQGGTPGPGASAVTGYFTLQTYTFAPEPSSSLLLVLGGLSLALKRRRVKSRDDAMFTVPDFCGK